MIITWLIIGITALISYMAFQNSSLMEKMQFNAARIIHQKQYYRLVSHAFIHVSWSHLAVNMLVLYFFGRNIEIIFQNLFGMRGTLFYLMLYLGGILVSNIWGLIKHQNDYYYNAVGASGAVSAVLFAYIFLEPMNILYLFMIIPIPGILFAIGYLVYSYQMGKKKSDNIAHDAHFLGAVFGFIFPLLLRPDLFGSFINKLFSFL